ncbi:MAG: prepilin-type N-terminal cleavage/methylation domain-containing protein [Planctomycetota bacterium]
MADRRPTVRSGFTLVEIIVVIGIIAILAAFILPVLANARRSARLAQCTSQLRQLGMALTMYDMDHDLQTENYTGRLTSLFALQYAVDPKIFICPMDYTKATKDSSGIETLKPIYRPGIPKDNKASWAERFSHGAQDGYNEQNCSYLYEFSTRTEGAENFVDDFLVYWNKDVPMWMPDLEDVDRDGNGTLTWQEAKFFQLDNGDVYVTGFGNPPGGVVWRDISVEADASPMRCYPRTWLPIIRCFWHCTPKYVDEADINNRGPEEVLNLAIGGNTFFSVPGWEQTAWKYGASKE